MNIYEILQYNGLDIYSIAIKTPQGKRPNGWSYDSQRLYFNGQISTLSLPKLHPLSHSLSLSPFPSAILPSIFCKKNSNPFRGNRRRCCRKCGMGRRGSDPPNLLRRPPLSLWVSPEPAPIPSMSPPKSPSATALTFGPRMSKYVF